MQKSHLEAVMEHHMETGWLMIVDHDFLLLENSQKLNHTILDKKKNIWRECEQILVNRYYMIDAYQSSDCNIHFFVLFNRSQGAEARLVFKLIDKFIKVSLNTCFNVLFK